MGYVDTVGKSTAERSMTQKVETAASEGNPMTCLYVPPSLKAQAKSAGINMSETLREALTAKLEKIPDRDKEVDVNDM